MESKVQQLIIKNSQRNANHFYLFKIRSIFKMIISCAYWEVLQESLF